MGRVKSLTNGLAQNRVSATRPFATVVEVTRAIARTVDRPSAGRGRNGVWITPHFAILLTKVSDRRPPERHADGF